MSDFDRCAPFIEAALEYSGGTHDIEDIRRGVEDGTFQFWPGERSAIVTELLVSPKVKMCNLFLGGGNGEEIQRMIRNIEQWAKREGCQRMTMTGRKGWGRSFLLDDGYVTKWHVMAKEI